MQPSQGPFSLAKGCSPAQALTVIPNTSEVELAAPTSGHAHSDIRARNWKTRWLVHMRAPETGISSSWHACAPSAKTGARAHGCVCKKPEEQPPTAHVCAWKIIFRFPAHACEPASWSSCAHTRQKTRWPVHALMLPFWLKRFANTDLEEWDIREIYFGIVAFCRFSQNSSLHLRRISMSPGDNIT